MRGAVCSDHLSSPVASVYLDPRSHSPRVPDHRPQGTRQPLPPTISELRPVVTTKLATANVSYKHLYHVYDYEIKTKHKKKTKKL